MSLEVPGGDVPDSDVPDPSLPDPSLPETSLPDSALSDPRVPEDHPLRDLFRDTLNAAFRDHASLYAPDVAEHIGDNVLGDFLHVDRLYRLQDLDGRRLDELPDMLEVSQRKEGPERRIEVDRYIGDFVMFMVGFFPGFLRKARLAHPRTMISKVGSSWSTSSGRWTTTSPKGAMPTSGRPQPAAVFDPISQGTFRRLGEDMEGYVGVVRRVREILDEDPGIHELDGILA